MTDLPPEFEEEFEEEIIASEVVKHDAPANERSIARRVALQILYELDVTGHRMGDVIDFHLHSQDISKKAMRYARRLVENVNQNRELLDKVIQHYAPEFPLDQVAVVDRNVLRMAVCELGIFGRIPIGVAIDEAVQLAKMFGAEASPRFINGVLGALASDETVLREVVVSDDDEDDDDDWDEDDEE